VGTAVQLVFLIGLCAGLLLLDSLIPLGVAAGVPYIVVILLGRWLPWRHSILILTLICSVLIIVGYFLSPADGILWMVIVNRALALIAVSVTAILVLQSQQAERALKNAYDTLEQLVEQRTSELQLSEQRMRDYSQAVSDWFWETDQHHRFSYFSEVDIKKFPLERSKVLGKTRWEVANADVRDEPWRKHKSDLDLHKPFRNFRYQATDVHGKRVWLNISGSPVFDGSGEFVGYRGTATNITDYVKLEERTQQNLKMEALGVLAGGIAHDLNNTLVPIIGMTELVRDDLPAESEDRGNLEIVLHAAMHARELVAQILAFSRQEDRSYQRIDLAAELHDILQLLKTTIPTTVTVSENIIPVGDINADRTQIDQIVMNLISNAVHAMEGHGNLSIRLDVIDIDDKMRESHPKLELGSYARISIQDSGLGISENERRRIFDPFFTTKDVGMGTGLGLSVVYGIVSDHNGTITVSSEPGQGATFDVYLPIISDEDDANTRP